MARALQFLHPDGRPVVIAGEASLGPACAIWQGVPIEVWSLRGPGEMGPMHTAFPSVSLCVHGDGHNDVWSGRSKVRLPFQSGTLAIHEGGFEASRCEWQGAGEVISIQIPPDSLPELTNGQSEPLALQTLMPFEDETLSALLIAMRDELRRDCNTGRMFAQGLSLALIGYLRSRYGAPAPTRRTLGKLSQRELSEVIEYVEFNLMRDIGIDELASLLSLSSSQFSRLFKATVGSSPYRYLQQKRVERAVELMRGPDSLAQIAQSVGLANQSHFTQIFRQITGVTPARARSTWGS
jgi:AraC family transcriptional regulator